MYATGEMPSGANGSPLITGGSSGSNQPHVLLCRMPNTRSASPRADSTTLSRSMRSVRSPGTSLMRPDTISTSVITMASATNTYRHDE